MSTLKINTLSNLAGTQSTAIENAINGSAKAWVNFNGTGTVAIRGQYNVSSITDNGTGDYTVNFATVMPNTNYAAICSGNASDTDDASGRVGTTVRGTSTTLTSSVRLICVWAGDGATFSDKPVVTVAVFR